MMNYLVEDVFYYYNVSRKSVFRLWRERIKYFDLTIVLNGELKYEVNGETYVVKKNDAILVQYDDVRYRYESDMPAQYISFNFTLLPDVPRLDLPVYMPDCISSDIKKLFTVFNQKRLSPYYHSKMKLVNLLNYILFELMDSVALESNNEHVVKIIKYVDDHITEQMSLQSISKEIGLSKEYTASIFKNETGCTVTHYINDKKMSFAKEIINHEEMSLGELATYLGYDNYSYFSRLFKHHFGLSPQEYKAMRKRGASFNKDNPQDV